MSFQWLNWDNIERVARLIVRLRKKYPGRGYVVFGRFGLSLCIIGLSVFFPPVWELLLPLFVELLTNLGWLREPVESANNGTEIQALRASAIVVFLIGLGIILLSLKGYHNFLYTEPPGNINEGAISIDVLPNLHPFEIIKSVALQTSRIVDVPDYRPQYNSMTVLNGKLYAQDFEEFVEKIAQRTKPQNKFNYTMENDILKISLINNFS